MRAAVETGGPSREQAAARFGAAPSSAIKWVARFRTTESVAPAKMGGYVCLVWTKEPARFKVDPAHQSLGLNIELALFEHPRPAGPRARGKLGMAALPRFIFGCYEAPRSPWRRSV